ncbi:Hypothetical protein TPAS_2147 [Trichococcus pasteurii]|uniref:Uncharacterized protein n=1 Tax=Trichococcus pasteurii TaxID=43064 RepID=A0A1W1II07_9LACT|nr:hypothetical protein SAMN04488086_10532 [Trichococcus pasteurii]SLM52453.1 Hypothetical protein TPAS_2147 [Trichococcus pasteurii]SSB93334.1 Hypothetical protein TPAS_2147 [Trichococcus pasteurii]
MTVLAAFYESKKKSRLAIAFQRGYNDCEGPNSFIKAALRIAPASSNPATLARDRSYSTKAATAYAAPTDLFPQTLQVWK